MFIAVDDSRVYTRVHTMTPNDGKIWNCPLPSQEIPRTRIKDPKLKIQQSTKHCQDSINIGI